MTWMFYAYVDAARIITDDPRRPDFLRDVPPGSAVFSKRDLPAFPYVEIKLIGTIREEKGQPFFDPLPQAMREIA